jgi:hypothetical protein
MDAATDSKVEVKGSMNVTEEHWNSIFKPKPMTEEHAKYVLDELGWNYGNKEE